MSPQTTTTSQSSTDSQQSPAIAADGFDLQRELDEVERLVLQSRHIPLTNITLVNEERLLAQLDRTFDRLPGSILEAKEIVRDREEILESANAYARDTIARAEQRAAAILDETGIVRRAQQDARQLHERARLECDRLRQQTLQDIRQMRQQAVQECEELREDAEDYAADMLQQLEQRLGNMLQVVRKGRTSLHKAPARSAPAAAKGQPVPSMQQAVAQ